MKQDKRAGKKLKMDGWVTKYLLTRRYVCMYVMYVDLVIDWGLSVVLRRQAQSRGLWPAGGRVKVIPKARGLCKPQTVKNWRPFAVRLHSTHSQMDVEKSTEEEIEGKK